MVAESAHTWPAADHGIEPEKAVDKLRLSRRKRLQVGRRRDDTESVQFAADETRTDERLPYLARRVIAGPHRAVFQRNRHGRLAKAQQCARNISARQIEPDFPRTDAADDGCH